MILSLSCLVTLKKERERGRICDCLYKMIREKTGCAHPFLGHAGTTTPFFLTQKLFMHLCRFSFLCFCFVYLCVTLDAELSVEVDPCRQADCVLLEGRVP